MGKCIDNPKYDKPASAIQNTWKHTHSIEKPKQETLEEVVKITQSKMYSEEEVLVLLELAVKRGLYLESGVIPYQANVTKEWFETIKKK